MINERVQSLQNKSCHRFNLLQCSELRHRISTRQTTYIMSKRGSGIIFPLLMMQSIPYTTYHCQLHQRSMNAMLRYKQQKIVSKFVRENSLREQDKWLELILILWNRLNSLRLHQTLLYIAHFSMHLQKVAVMRANWKARRRSRLRKLIKVMISLMESSQLIVSESY